MASKEYEVVFLFKAKTDAAIGQVHSVSDALESLNKKHAELQEALANIENLKASRQHIKELESAVNDLKVREQETAANLEAATAARKEAEQDYNRHTLRITELRGALREEKAQYDANIAVLKMAKAAKSEIEEEELRHRIAVIDLTHELKAETDAQKRSAQEKEAAVRAEKEAARAHNEATAALKESSKELQKEKEAAGEMERALESAGVKTEELEKEEIRLNDALKENAKDLNKATEASEAYAQKLERFESAAHGLKAISQILAPAGAAAKETLEYLSDSLETAADLEKQTSAIKAVSGASPEEMERITKQIRDTGATTIFTAGEVANAVEKMALAGWDAQQMIEAIPGVVNLAASAGEDLTGMAEFLVDGMNAFGLSGTEAAKKFADVLAKTATSSSTNAALLADSFSYVQSTAANLEYSVEDVAVALGIAANNSLKGSTAGQALATALTRMSGANQTAAKAMKEYELDMFNANGEAKPLLQYLEEMRAVFKGLSDQDRQILANRLAGQRGQRVILALMNEEDEKWQSMIQDIYNYEGAAEKISTERLDNYSGKLQLLSDAWTDLKISIGNQLIPVASEGVDWLTTLTGKTNDLVNTNPELAVWATGAAGAVLGVSKAAEKASSVVQGLYFIMRMLPDGVKLSSVIGSVGGVTAALAALAGATLVAVDMGRKSASYQNNIASKEFRERLAEDFASTEEMRASMAELAQMASTPEEINYARLTVDAVYDEEIEKYERELEEAKAQRKKFVDDINGKTPGLLEYNRVTGQYERSDIFVSKYSDLGPKDKETLNATNEAVAELTEKIRELDEERANYYEKLVATYQEETGLQSISMERYGEIEDALKGLALAWAEVWEQTYAAYSSAFELFEKAEAKTANIDDMLAALQSQGSYWETYGKNLNTLKTAAEEAGINLSGLWDELASKGDEQSAAYIQAIVDSLGDLDDPDLTKLQELVTLYENVITLRQGATDVFTAGTDEIEWAFEDYNETLKAAIEESESYDEAKTAMTLTLDGYMDAISEMEPEIIKAVSRMMSNVEAQINNTGIGDYKVVKSGKGSGSEIVSAKGARKQAAAEIVEFTYAKGTDNAPPGVSLVGEEGPELLVMRGGESVIPARETERLLLASHTDTVIPSAYAKGTDNALPGMALVGEEGPELLVMHGGETVIPARETERLLLASHTDTVIPSAYAKGTDNALPGMALVGEKGPEILTGNGSESIINTAGMWKLILMTGADRRQKAGNTPLRLFRDKERAEAGGNVQVQRPGGGSRERDGQSGPITFAPQITIMGNADKETIEEALEEAERRFGEWWARMERNRARTAY